MVSPITGELAISALGSANNQQQQRRRQQPPKTDEPEDTVELSSEGPDSDGTEEQAIGYGR